MPKPSSSWKLSVKRIAGGLVLFTLLLETGVVPVEFASHTQQIHRSYQSHFELESTALTTSDSSHQASMPIMQGYRVEVHWVDGVVRSYGAGKEAAIIQAGSFDMTTALWLPFYKQFEAGARGDVDLNQLFVRPMESDSAQLEEVQIRLTGTLFAEVEYSVSGVTNGPAIAMAIRDSLGRDWANHLLEKLGQAKLAYPIAPVSETDSLKPGITPNFLH